MSHNIERGGHSALIKSETTTSISNVILPADDAYASISMMASIVKVHGVSPEALSGVVQDGTAAVQAYVAKSKVPIGEAEFAIACQTALSIIQKDVLGVFVSFYSMLFHQARPEDGLYMFSVLAAADPHFPGRLIVDVKFGHANFTLPLSVRILTITDKKSAVFGLFSKTSTTSQLVYEPTPVTMQRLEAVNLSLLNVLHGDTLRAIKDAKDQTRAVQDTA
ncbi:unnamed protein product [Vitrella brassicaformis CCMP3155]|uniref:Uncharacterized protein n=2 Tax=Vitrella brassicaformis TaxID=1169539 RepID=A0A0G4FUW2_VITBC|nr:unnamed protein product [Vitrella brassicaformis CCMP3155]|eukprot:CEM18679.1 unnamed protein product [Vitrella brassicaformis CCMP3155]